MVSFIHKIKRKINEYKDEVPPRYSEFTKDFTIPTYLTVSYIVVTKPVTALLSEVSKWSVNKVPELGQDAK